MHDRAAAWSPARAYRTPSHERSNGVSPPRAAAKDCKGQRIVVQGVVTALAAMGHDHDHGADVAAHECPMPSYVLSTQGAELVAKK